MNRREILTSLVEDLRNSIEVLEENTPSINDVLHACKNSLVTEDFAAMCLEISRAGQEIEKLNGICDIIEDHIKEAQTIE